ncbi:MAG: DUF3822 family protein, partial [Sphingobacteriales bacterium]
NAIIAHQLKALIPSIKILPEETEQLVSADYHLTVLIGSGDWQFALLHKQRKRLDWLLSFHFEKDTLLNDFASQWDEVMTAYPFLNKYFSSVTVVYRYNETVLLPNTDYNAASNAAILDTLYGENTDAVIKDDFVAAEDLNIVYRIPSIVYYSLQRNYINASVKHYYGMELQALSKTAYENVILINFFGNQFGVTVIKTNQLQLMHTYNYSKTEDVLFYLLTIAKEFNCNREEIILLIGGMIEEKSVLFADINKYFLTVQMTGKPETIDTRAAFNEFPLHYFNPVFTIASCVL